MESPILPVVPVRRVVMPGAAATIRILDAEARETVASWTGPRLGLALRRDDPDAPPGRDGVHSVGTEVSVLDRFEDADRTELAVLGLRSFDIAGRPEGSRSLLAEVVPNLEETAGVDPRLAIDVVRRMRRYLGLLAETRPNVSVHFEPPGSTAALSFQVASRLRLSPPEQQELLATRPVAARLGRLVRMLERETDLLYRMIGAGGAE